LTTARGLLLALGGAFANSPTAGEGGTDMMTGIDFEGLEVIGNEQVNASAMVSQQQKDVGLSLLRLI